MIAGVIAIAVMLPIALGRGQVAVSETGVERATGSSDPTPSATGSTTGTPSSTGEPTADETPVIAVYGDAYSADSAQGGEGAAVPGRPDRRDHDHVAQ